MFAVGVDEADDGGAVAGVSSEPLERRPVVGHESGFEHEVFRRISGDRQLGEGDEIATVGVGPVVRFDQLGDVAIEVAHGRVELGQRRPRTTVTASR